MKKISKNIVFLILSIFAILLLLGGMLYSQFEIGKKSKYQKLWIGLIKNRNFRDISTSLNDCSKKNILKTNKIFRANKFFSGWSCASVGNPDKIYSLNFDPSQATDNFCYEENGEKNIGRHYNRFKITEDLEDLSTWQNPRYNAALCQFVSKILQDIENNEKVLIHCNAGRDRTGALSALLGALFLEASHLNKESISKTLECDYRKTSNLETFKFGLISKMTQDLFQEHGGPSLFLNKTCGISMKLISKATLKMLR